MRLYTSFTIASSDTITLSTADMLPIRVEIPRSAMCGMAQRGFQGHRVRVTYAGTKRQRQICGNCKMEIEHEPGLGTYVTPFTIEEEPV